MMGSPEADIVACVFTVCAQCVHCIGFECVRAASMALLGAEGIGLGNEALSLTALFGTPVGAVVLYWYTHSIQEKGPKTTLRISEAGCVVFVGVVALQMSLGIQTGAKYIAILFYSFREIYFTLLSTQYRAHISTLLGIPQSKYLATISGVISVTTAIGGYLVGIVVHQFGGVKGLVSTAAFAIIVSSLCFELSMRYCGRGSYRTKKKGKFRFWVYILA